MDAVVTLPERKRRDLARRRMAIQSMMAELPAIARSCGGRIVLFGSATTGNVTERSDIDLLLDMPAHAEATAWSRLEELACRYEVPADIHSVRTSCPSFVARVEATGREYA